MLITSAHAQAVGTSAATGGGFAGVLSIAPLFLVFIVFWLLMVRPQQKRQRDLQRKVDAVRKNDTVVTAGGVVGKVTRIEERHVEVEIAPNVRIRVVKGTLAEVTSPNGKPAND